DRMNHACTQDFQPPGVLADGTTLAATDHTVHIYLHARLGEWEVTLTESHLPPFAKHLIRKVCQYTFEVAEADFLPNCYALYLVEHRLRAGCHLLVAVDFTREDDPQRFWRIGSHRMNLSWTRVGP